ncbi:Oxygen-independent coproporphyrinogen-III oxidase [compost metagenome]
MERLACDLELDILALERRYGLNFQDYFPVAWRQLEAMSRAGLVELNERFISILPAGRAQVDSICQVFEQQVNGTGLTSNHEWVDHDASL